MAFFSAALQGEEEKTTKAQIMRKNRQKCLNCHISTFPSVGQCEQHAKSFRFRMSVLPNDISAIGGLFGTKGKQRQNRTTCKIAFQINEFFFT